MPGESKVRIKDMSKESLAKYNTLSSDMKSFIDEYQSMTGRPLNITSGKRSASQKVGSASKTSHHNTGNAFDISSIHTEDYSFLVNTREGLTLMNKYGLGIIDETNPDEMKKTGATGEHFHIGKDSKYKALVDQRLSTYGTDSFKPIQSYKEYASSGGDPNSFQDHFIGDGHDHNNTSSTAVPEQSMITNDPLQQREYLQLDMRLVEKQMIKEAKMDDDRNLLMEKQQDLDNKVQQANDFLTAFSNRNTINNDPLFTIEAQNQQQDFVQGYNYENVQTQEYNPNRFIYTTQQ